MTNKIQTTTFSRIAGAFRKSCLDNDQSMKVRLEFDGDPLDPNAQVQATEVSDADVIDVYVFSFIKQDL